MDHTTMGPTTTDPPTTRIPTTIPITTPTISPISPDPATTTTGREDTDIGITRVVEERTAVPVWPGYAAHAACWKHVCADHTSHLQAIIAAPL